MIVCSECYKDIPDDSFICVDCGALNEEAHREVVEGFAIDLKDQGNTALKSGDYETAEITFQSLVRIMPGDSEASDLLKKSSESLGTINRAMRNARKFLDEKRYDDSKSELQKILDINYHHREARELLSETELLQERFNALFEKGKRLLDENRYSEALREFERAKSITYDNSGVTEFIVNARNQQQVWQADLHKLRNLVRSGDFKATAAHGKKLLDRRPFDEEVSEAVKNAEDAMRTLSENRKTADSALADKKWDRAVDAFDAILKITPEDEDVRKAREKAASEAVREKTLRTKVIAVSAAVIILATVIIIFASIYFSNRGSLQRGIELLEQGRPESALSQFESAGHMFVSTDELESYKKKARFRILLQEAHGLRLSGELENAASVYAKAAEMMPGQGGVGEYVRLVEILKELEKAQSHVLDGSRNYYKTIAGLQKGLGDLGEIENLPDAKEAADSTVKRINELRKSWIARIERDVEDGYFIRAAMGLAEMKKVFPDDERTAEVNRKTRDGWFKLARNFRDQGNWDRAKEEYDKMTMYFPEDVELGRERRHLSVDRNCREARRLLEKGELVRAWEKVSEASRDVFDYSEMVSDVAELRGEVMTAREARFEKLLSEAGELVKRAYDNDAAGLYVKAENMVKEALLLMPGDDRATSLLERVVALKSTPAGMVYVPAGKCIIGYNLDKLDADWYPYEGPLHQASTGAYYIDVFPVTNLEYRKFLDANPDAEVPSHWKDGTIPEGEEKFPVVNVDLAMARAYAAWAGKRLPTEIEWEKAARGPEGFKYPWGNELKDNAAATGDGLKPVGSYPEGASPWGCHDMAGNVWEWTDTAIYLYPGSERKIAPEHEGAFVIKGGCHTTRPGDLRCSMRRCVKPDGPDAKRPTLGFRCVRDIRKQD